jgi:hypothetical protein
VEAKEHSAGFLGALGEPTIRKELEVVGQNEQVQKLVCRPKRNRKTTREIAVVVPTTSLRDIAPHGDAGTTQLIHDTEPLLFRKPPSDTVNVTGQVVRSLPDIQFSEVAHIPSGKRCRAT